MKLHSYTELLGLNIRDDSDVSKIWIYEDILTQNRMSLFDHYLKQAINQETRLNAEGRSFLYDGHRINLIGTHVRHDYIKLWSAFDYKDYYYLTADTAMDWYRKTTERDIPPGLRQLIDVVENQVDVFKDTGPVMALRFFVNVFEPGLAMDPHMDGGQYQLNLDIERDNLWSATYYLQVSEKGGELWIPNTDFKYKPTVNSLAIFNGNKFSHGVLGVPPGDKTRISITIRYAALKDLVWPGHPDKFLYKPNLDLLI